MTLFADRDEAGRRLAQELAHHRDRSVVVLGIPRGGVVVAAPVAALLDAPLGALVARKVGAPGNPELAIGAVSGTGEVVVDRSLVSRLGLAPSQVERQVSQARAEVRRRQEAYPGLPTITPATVVIVVDDGVATGATLQAALESLRQVELEALVAAIPVAPADVVERLEGMADDVVCLATPSPFWAVGQWYERFEQVDDDTVRTLVAG